MAVPVPPAMLCTYVIVFVDCLTKWVEAYALSDQTSETIARVLVDNVICQHGRIMWPTYC